MDKCIGDGLATSRAWNEVEFDSQEPRHQFRGAVPYRQQLVQLIRHLEEGALEPHACGSGSLSQILEEELGRGDPTLEGLRRAEEEDCAERHGLILGSQSESLEDVVVRKP